MTSQQAVEKVTKLLALAGSDNPNEAEAALLMARKIMAQYKLTERDLKIKAKSELKQTVYEKRTYSGKKNPWMPTLGTLIAQHNCCACVSLGREGSTVHNVKFVGLDDDPVFALTMFDYATEFIKKKESEKRTDLYHRKLYPEKMINDYMNDFIFNYALGFCEGLKKKYEEQNQEIPEETALVLVTPKEVTDYTDQLKRTKIKYRKVHSDQNAMMAGYNDGYSFNPQLQLQT